MKTLDLPESKLTYDRIFADAKLIASAPEMLAALKVSERFLDSVAAAVCCVGHDHCNCSRCCALRSVRDAITKAGGWEQ